MTEAKRVIETMEELLHTALNELAAIGGIYSPGINSAEVRNSREYKCLESTLTKALDLATAETDPTPATVEWLESIGVAMSPKDANEVCYSSMLVGGKPHIILEWCDDCGTITRLLSNPTRGQVLKIVSALGGGG
jgi:hypothetical protein